MTTPNLVLLAKMVSMLRFVDDATYYAYHRTHYDQSFATISSIAWNLTNSKRIMPQLDGFYEQFNISYVKYLPSVSTSNTSATYIDLDSSVT